MVTVTQKATFLSNPYRIFILGLLKFNYILNSYHKYSLNALIFLFHIVFQKSVFTRGTMHTVPRSLSFAVVSIARSHILIVRRL